MYVKNENHLQGFVCNWLTTARGTHPDVFVQCLLPHPPEYAKVGGMWDKLSSRQEQVHEGLSKILTLIPYEIISLEVWSTIMPEWMETICSELSDKELNELKMILCKLFESDDLGTSAFSVEQTFRFITERLANGDRLQQNRALDWLLVLSGKFKNDLCEFRLESGIAIGFDIVCKMITAAAQRAQLIYSIAQPTTGHPAHSDGSHAPISAKRSAQHGKHHEQHPIIVSRVVSQLTIHFFTSFCFRTASARWTATAAVCSTWSTTRVRIKRPL